VDNQILKDNIKYKQNLIDELIFDNTMMLKITIKLYDGRFLTREEEHFMADLYDKYVEC
jgi:hypothetical protein